MDHNITTLTEEAWTHLGHAEYALWQAMKIERRLNDDGPIAALHRQVQELGVRAKAQGGVPF